MTSDLEEPTAGPSVNSAVLQAFEPYIDALAERLAAVLERRRGRMINQYDSELGNRRHRDAVKRRMANGEGGAGKSGRNYLLTREAMREELARPWAGARSEPPPAPAATKSRSRDLSEFERSVMSGLRAVKDPPR